MKTNLLLLYCFHLKMFLKTISTVSKTTISQITSFMLCIAILTTLTSACGNVSANTKNFYKYEKTNRYYLTECEYSISKENSDDNITITSDNWLIWLKSHKGRSKWLDRWFVRICKPYCINKNNQNAFVAINNTGYKNQEQEFKKKLTKHITDNMEDYDILKYKISEYAYNNLYNNDTFKNLSANDAAITLEVEKGWRFFGRNYYIIFNKEGYQKFKKKEQDFISLEQQDLEGFLSNDFLKGKTIPTKGRVSSC